MHTPSIKTFHILPLDNISTIALIITHYLHDISRVYLTFAKDKKVQKTVGNIDPQIVHIHMYTLENSHQNHAK